MEPRSPALQAASVLQPSVPHIRQMGNCSSEQPVTCPRFQGWELQVRWTQLKPVTALPGGPIVGTTSEPHSMPQFTESSCSSLHSILPTNFPVRWVFSVQFSRSVVSDFATPWTTARQAFLSITNSRSLLKLMSIESVMPSNHLMLCRPLLLPPSIIPSIRMFLVLA